MLGRFPYRSQSRRGVSRRHARGRHGRRRASSGVPATVLRVGIGSRGGVDLAGAVCLGEVSPSARLAGRSWQRRRVPCSVSLTSGAWLLVREEGENREIFLFSEF